MTLQLSIADKTLLSIRGDIASGAQGATNVKPRTRWLFASALAPTLKARVPPAGPLPHNVEAGIESLVLRFTRVFASAIAARPPIPLILNDVLAWSTLSMDLTIPFETYLFSRYARKIDKWESMFLAYGKDWCTVALS